MKLPPKSLIALVGSPSHLSRTVAGLALLLWAIGASIQPAQAEGSRELVGNGGFRPYTEWRIDKTGKIVRRTLLKVYAKAGEVVNLGSSAVGIVGSSGSTVGNAVLFAPSDNVDTSTPLVDCQAKQAIEGLAYGLLNTRAQEVAGPAPSGGGYLPCTFTPTVDGIYQVAFYGPDGKNGMTEPSGEPITASASVNSPLINANQKSTVAMWDIAVRSSAISTIDINGRVFTDYVALMMGGNGRQLKSALYILTDDGYRYRTALNGLDPYGFIFFANSQGLLQPNGQTLYHSAVDTIDDELNALAGGVKIQPPEHKMFFNPSSDAAITAIGSSLTPITPLPAQNFKFTGGTGGSGNQAPQSVGGTFSFDAPQNGSYQIFIDTNNDGLYTTAAGDRILEGANLSGFNTVAWDGKNGTGADVPALLGNAPYQAKILLKGGEYHFPILDVESNTPGFTIKMLNPPGGVSLFSNGSSPTSIYYDERDYTVNSTLVTLGCDAAITIPCDARGRTESFGGGHKFGTNYGNAKAIDTWIYFPSANVFAPLVITTGNQAEVRAKKSVKFLADVDSSNSVTVDDQVQYTITYSNLAPASTGATSFVITDNLPTQLNFVNAQITSQTAGNTIALRPGYAGSGALTNTGTLRVGDSITITITATINNQNSGNSISNQASATFGTVDNPATTATVVTDADSSGSTTDTPTVGNPFQQIANDNIEQGNSPTNKGDDEPTLFKVAVSSSRIRLVKRITRINTTDINSVIDPTTTVDSNDNASSWLSGYLRGAIDGGKVQPGDIVEYTIYFLSDGGTRAQDVNICDLVPRNSAFVPNAFSPPSGIALAIGSSTPTSFLTNIADGTDGGQFVIAPTATPVPCSSSNSTANPNGAIVVNIAPVVPNFSSDSVNSYGFIRFRAKVN